jgi:hypothetical protein
MSKIQDYEAQEKQTTTSKMKKLCTNKQTNTSQLADDRDPSPS